MWQVLHLYEFLYKEAGGKALEHLHCSIYNKKYLGTKGFESKAQFNSENPWR